MKIIFMITVVLLFFINTSFAADTPTIEICKFKNGKKAAVSLTFDDACKDHLTHAVPLLEKSRNPFMSIQ
jgi:peptidoglycan/xylan/chitin deacetylase (PgdA/CDA1 family)